MSTQQQVKYLKDITAYSYFDLLKELSPYLKDDIEFDFETNEGFPKQIGIAFTCRVQTKTQPPLEDISQEVTDQTKDQAAQQVTKEVKPEKQTRRSLAKASNT